MQKRRLYLLLIGVGVVGAALVVFIPGGQPSYGRRSLSSWLEVYGNRYYADGTDPFGDAIRHMGTNTLPYLVKWITYEPPAWKTNLHAKFNPILRSINKEWSLTDWNEVRAFRVFRAFSILGHNAREAVPALTRLLHDPKNVGRARRIAIALASIGKDAVPPLVAAITNQHPRIRAAGVLGISFLATNTLSSLPLVISRLNDEDVEVASEAASCLGQFKIEPRPAVEALTSALKDSRPLVRQAATSALSGFRDDARPAIPTLIECLKDPDEMVVLYTISVLSRLKLEAGLVVPALIASLEDSRPRVQNTAAMALGKFGNDAHLAVPQLLALLKHNDKRFRDAATNALRAIDPKVLEDTVKNVK